MLYVFLNKSDIMNIKWEYLKSYNCHLVLLCLVGFIYLIAYFVGWGCPCGVMVIVVGIGHGDTSSNPGHSTNTLGKGMNPIILPPAMGK